MPAPLVAPPAGMQRVDLRQMSMDELHAAAAATQPRDVFAALLPDPPGGLWPWFSTGSTGVRWVLQFVALRRGSHSANLPLCLHRLRCPELLVCRCAT